MGRSRTRRRAAGIRFVPGATRAKRLSVGALAALTAGPGVALSEASASSDGASASDVPTTTEHTVAVTPTSGAHHIRALQRALGLHPDGVFGPHTRTAVHHFQTHHGLRADGVAGPRTTAALRSRSVPASPPAPSGPSAHAAGTDVARATSAANRSRRGRARTASEAGGAMYEASNHASSLVTETATATVPVVRHHADSIPAQPTTDASTPSADSNAAFPTGAQHGGVAHTAPAVVRVSETGGSAAQSGAPGRASSGAGGSGSSATSAGVAAVVAAGNRIARLPYRYGGGHGSFNDNAYDCSGSVSYALHGAGLISSPEASPALESYGAAGTGKRITVYANAGHAFMTVDGRRFDTVALQQTGSRWSSQPTSTAGYVARHPVGY